MISPPRERTPPIRLRAVALLMIFDTLLAPAVILGGALMPALGGFTETQDPSTEVVTAQWVFDGTDGSFYNATVGGPSGATLGNVSRSFTLGRGWWGAGSTFNQVRFVYPGNLTLSPSGAANEVFHARVAAPPRDRNAAGVTQWTAGTPTNSIHVIAFDIDGDGFLDDAVLGYTGNQNRIYTYNQAGTLIGTRALPPGAGWINDLAAVDTNSDGRLDEIAVADEA